MAKKRKSADCILQAMNAAVMAPYTPNTSTKQATSLLCWPSISIHPQTVADSTSIHRSARCIGGIRLSLFAIDADGVGITLDRPKGRTKPALGNAQGDRAHLSNC